MLLREEQQIDAKNSNFEKLESTLYMESLSMPLSWKLQEECDLYTIHSCNHPCIVCSRWARYIAEQSTEMGRILRKGLDAYLEGSW